ncbi:MBL fold metallo-hydrolase [Planctomycetota bacterium]
MLTGKELLAQIDLTQLPPGQVALWWAGQQGYIIKTAQTVIYLDVFFSPHPRRQIPLLIPPEFANNADIVFGTHDHKDHIDRQSWPALAKASPQATFVVPELLRTDLAEDLNIPAERFIGINDCQTTQLKGLKITGIASAHELLERDENTGLYPYMGYVIEADGFYLYHCGDCCIYEGLQTKLKQFSIDLSMLPINGRDAVRLARGCIGCMTYQEAADLAGAIESKLTLPGHYDMFADNSEDPKLFTEYMKVKYPHLQTKICQHAQRLILNRNDL